MFIASDPSYRGVETALRIRDLARELKLNIRRIALLVSRVRDGLPDKIREAAEKGNLEIAGVIPEDPLIREYDEEGKPLVDVPADSAARQAVVKILRKYVDVEPISGAKAG
jgi:CO dehydrogenase maturation factor